MAKFCGKCGARLDEATGLCPNCDHQPLKQQTTEPKPEPTPRQERKSPRVNKKLKRILTLAAAAVLVLSVLGILALSGILGGDDYEVPRVDAEDYFEENSNVLDVINAKTSPNVLTEAEVFQLLTDRGFDQFPITTNYNMEGEYVEEMEISENSNTKHPIYQTFYVNENGDYWTIVVINGTIMADPLSYNRNSGKDVPTVLSETEEIMSYDGEENSFFKTLPHDTVMTVMVVDRIDSVTLEELTKGALDEL